MSIKTRDTVRLSSKGQLVIPRKIRRKLHWEPGMELTVSLTGSGVTILPRKKPAGKSLQELRGCLKYDGPRISNETLQAPIDYRGDWNNRETHNR